MDHNEVNAILKKTVVGMALLPLLKNFEGEDLVLYQLVAQTLFRAYEIGLKDGMPSLHDRSEAGP